MTLTVLDINRPITEGATAATERSIQGDSGGL